MQENILQTKRDFRNLQLGVREVHDRPIGTFEHSVNSLRNNSFAVITVPSIGEIGLISKARNYSTTQYDVMVSYLTEDLSAIDSVDVESRKAFFEVLADLYEVTSKESGLKIAIGLNQHSEGFNLPERTKTGQKTRVQTLKPLHAHVYEVSKPTDKTLRMGNLLREDQRDMCDPLLIVTAEVIHNVLQSIPELKVMMTNIELSLGNSPMGINIHTNQRLGILFRENSQVLGLIQTKLADEYSSWKSIFDDKERVEQMKERLNSTNYSIYTKKILSTLVSNLKNEEEVKPDQVFVQGLAVTYTFFEDENSNAVISLHPRLMSHGNSADAFGLYVDNKEGEDQEELEAKRTFYRKAISVLSKKYQIRDGDFLKK